MKAEKHFSLKRADKVLGIIRRLIKAIPTDPYLDMSVQCHADGNAQGYYISCYQKDGHGYAVVFTQHIASVRVIFGTTNDFDPSHNLPYAQVRFKSRSFTNDLEAAQFIVEKLLGLPEEK